MHGKQIVAIMKIPYGTGLKQILSKAKPEENENGNVNLIAM